MLLRIIYKLAKLNAIFLFAGLTTETFLVKDTSKLFAVLIFAFEHEKSSSIHAFSKKIEY